VSVDSAAPPSTPGGHAPQGESGILLPFSVVSILLGLFCFVYWIFLSAAESQLTEEVQNQRWLLIGLAAYLSFQGLTLLLVRAARSPDLVAGLEGPLAERFRGPQRPPVWITLLYLPRIFVGYQRSRSFLNVVTMILLGGALLVLVNYLFARHNLWRWDLTSEQVNSLTDESLRLVRSLERDVRLVGIVPRRANHDLEAEQIQTLFEHYGAASSHVLVERLDPLQVSPLELNHRLAELELSRRTYEDYLGVVVQVGARTEEGFTSTGSKHIPLTSLWKDRFSPRQKLTTFLGEQLVSSAIMELLEGERPKLYFLEGHDEIALTESDQRKGLITLMQLLNQKNFAVEPLNLIEREERDVPDDASLLVVVGPQRALTQEEIAAITVYLEKGGDALFLLEPVLEVDREHTEFFETGLEDLLEKRYGIRAMNSLVLTMVQDQTGQLIPQSALALYQFDDRHPAVAPLGERKARVIMESVRPLQPVPNMGKDGLELTSIVKTSAEWGRRCFSTTRLHEVTTRQPIPTGAEQGPFEIVMTAEKRLDDGHPEEGPDDGHGHGALQEYTGPATRIVVFGDRGWITNQYLAQGSYSNLELFLNTVNWAIQREHRVVGRAHRPKSYRLEMTPRELTFYKRAVILGMPLMAIALGIFTWILRRS